MTHPRFSPGDMVFHIAKKATAQVLRIINRDDPEDVRRQGFRYLVEHSGFIWSVPEKHLTAPKVKIPSAPLRAMFAP